MSGQLTEKQHYVWRRYLRPWKQKPQDRGGGLVFFRKRK